MASKREDPVKNLKGDLKKPAAGVQTRGMVRSPSLPVTPVTPRSGARDPVKTPVKTGGAEAAKMTDSEQGPQQVRHARRQD